VNKRCCATQAATWLPVAFFSGWLSIKAANIGSKAHSRLSFLPQNKRCCMSISIIVLECPQAGFGEDGASLLVHVSSLKGWESVADYWRRAPCSCTLSLYGNPPRRREGILWSIGLTVRTLVRISHRLAFPLLALDWSESQAAARILEIVVQSTGPAHDPYLSYLAVKLALWVIAGILCDKSVPLRYFPPGTT